jgi:UDP-N-acetylmuramate: L-alanyl-gamma-D-glutamyl-meso-diaminopimelate ligase
VKVHLIAIGGSAMHNLAIALHDKGFKVTGSDDEIFEPSKSRLAARNILPEEIGWFPEKITADLDAVILGMHARQDNPELLRAQELGLKIYSYPEYIFNQTKDKIRVVIGGSHGKTSTTAMILHVLQSLGIDCDYMVGAQLAGFDCMVKLSESAPIAILEGDEYLSSPIDRRPKFHLYGPDIAVITGVAWDHINVFPTFENYVEQFKIFTDKISDHGTLIYSVDDAEVKAVAESARADIQKIAYTTFDHEVRNGITYLITEEGEQEIQIFGKHNLQNLSAAMLVCQKLGVEPSKFYASIATFKGASKRLELVMKNDTCAVYKDFAHSPSKLKATTNALKEQYPDRKLVACMELHTFSSLNENFLSEYHGAMAAADEAYVYFNPHTIAHKKLKPITPEQVREAFGGDNIRVFTDSKALFTELRSKTWVSANLLMMTSGTFDGEEVSKIVG